MAYFELGKDGKPELKHQTKQPMEQAEDSPTKDKTRVGDKAVSSAKAKRASTKKTTGGKK